MVALQPHVRYRGFHMRHFAIEFCHILSLGLSEVFCYLSPVDKLFLVWVPFLPGLLGNSHIPENASAQQSS